MYKSISDVIFFATDSLQYGIQNFGFYITPEEETSTNTKKFSRNVDKPFACPNCRNRYKHKHHLKRHILVECGQEPKFLCPFCPHRTKYKDSLTKHVCAVHPDVIPQM